MAITTNPLISRVSAALKADPRKTGMLGACVLVLLLVVVHALSGGARSAVANVLQKIDNVSSPASLAMAGASSSESSRLSKERASLQAWSDSPAAPVGRNLFAVRMDYFPFDSSHSGDVGNSDQGFWGKLEKSLVQQADEINKRENLRQSFRQQAAALRVESTLPGATPRAMVNGTLVSEGSVVAGFRICKIEARRLTVEREGVRFEIQMQ